MILAPVARVAAAPASPLPSDATSSTDRDRDTGVAAAGGGVARAPQSTGPTVEPDDEELTPLERHAARDAASNRAYAAPTALVAPPGSITIAARQPIGRGGIEAISGTFAFWNGRVLAEASVGFGWDAERRGATLGMKFTPRLRGRATFALAIERWQTDLDTGEPAASSFAVVGSVRTRDGRTLVSGHSGMIRVRGRVDLDPWVGASVVSGGPRWKLVVEADAGLEARAVVGGLYLGARYVRGPLAIDAGVASLGRAQLTRSTARPDSGGIPAWPMVAVAYRLR